MYKKNTNTVANPLVSILIVTLRGGENLKKCLTSIKKNIYKPYEMVVVNNGGGIKIKNEVNKIFPETKVVNIKNNTGFAEGNNTGFKYCRGKYILLLNDDTIVTPDFLQVLIEFGEQNKQAAVIQPKTIFTTGRLQSGADYLTSFGFLYHYGYGKNPDNPIYNTPAYMYSANGNCMLVRRNVIEKVGLFDEDFYAYFEETDFCHRVWLAGYKVVYFPKAVVYHKGAETTRIMDESISLYHPHKNRLCTYLKNLSLVNLIKILPPLLLIYQLLFLYFLLKRRFSEALYIQKSVWWNIKNLASTLRKRVIVQQKIRKLGDGQFMASISYTPKLSYFYKLLGNVGEYKDDNLVDEKGIIFDSEKILSKNTAVLIATFSPWIDDKRLPTNGSVEPMIDFFKPRVKKTVLIDQIYPGSQTVMPRIEVYEKNKRVKILPSSKWLYVLYPLLKMTNTPGTHVPFKLRDFFSVVEWCIRDDTRFDFYIGFECINAFAGILMRKFGFIKRVIYYVSDYSPERYPQKWFNSLYIFLDRFCAVHADYIWDVSLAMQPARIKAGLNPDRSAPVIHVPNALYPSQIKYNSPDRISRYTLVYMGTLGIENGPDMAIAAIPDIIKKYPKTILHIIGGGEKDLQRLKKMVSELKMEKKVRFYGYILDGDEMSKLIRRCYIALALYRAFPGSPRYYGDAGKIRAYAASGVPIITTSVPPLGREAADRGAAIVIQDNPRDLAMAIDKIFSDRRLYLALRKQSILFAENNTWENSFMNAFNKMKSYE